MHLFSTIGHTPLIRLNRIVEGSQAELWVKLESANPAGSLKDRVALAMVDGARKRGLLAPGSQIVEPTSGNTGIGLAMVCAQMRYALTLTMPENMSLERRKLLAAYGAKLVLTPAAYGMWGAVEEAERFAHTQGAVYLNQFSNPDNPAAHYMGTAPELVQQMSGKLDVFVAGIGTGGTITGVGRYLRDYLPSVRVVAVEPESSAVLNGEKAGLHPIEGIGAGFVPENVDRGVIHEILTVNAQEAILTARRMAAEEGISCGISSGANVAICLQLAKRPEFAGKRLVTLVCDSAERYLSTALFAG